MNKQLLLFFALLAFGFAQAQPCMASENVTVTNITMSTVTIGWTATGTETSWAIHAQPAGSPLPPNLIGSMITSINPFMLTGLECGTAYDVYIQPVCDQGLPYWSQPATFATMSCDGWLANVGVCDSGNDGIEPVDLSMQTPQVMAIADAVWEIPANECIVTYHSTFGEANTGANPLPDLFMATVSQQTVYVRAISSVNPEHLVISSFLVALNSTPMVPPIPNIQACDNTGSGLAIFDLNPTVQFIQASVDPSITTYSVAFYLTEADAIAQVNAILGGSFINTIANQLLYVVIEDDNTACATIETVMLQVVPCTGISMTAFLDANTNGVKDDGESNFLVGQFTYQQTGIEDIHTVTSQYGLCFIPDDNPGHTYDISFVIDPVYAAHYALATPSYANITIVDGELLQYSFPITIEEDYNDLAVSIIPVQAPRPGFSYSNKIRYTNLGAQTVASGTVTFEKDVSVTIIHNTQLGTVATATGFTYAFANLLPFETREMTVTMLVPAIPTVSLGDLLTNTASIEPLVDDVVPENNTSTVSQEIIGSYDPNDKMESRGGQILFSGFTSEDYLYYTIRFENTGTARAINVHISDVLDNKLDETSVRMVDASHDYVLDRLGNSLTWKFDNIELPHASSNPEGAKGYVHFKVKPKAGYAVGDIIPNTASIFFDFNPAIVTNTFNTEFVAVLGTPERPTSSFAMYPNPAGDHVTVLAGNSGSIANIAIYDMLGKTILSHKATGTTSETVNVSAISPGMYLLEVTTGNSVTAVKKLVIK